MTLRITVNRNGPYVIAAEDVEQVHLVDHEGNTIPPRASAGKPMKLCRCGASAVKPFCDGTHSRIGFAGAEAAREAFDAGTGGAAADSASVPQGDGAEKPLPPANQPPDAAR